MDITLYLLLYANLTHSQNSYPSSNHSTRPAQWDFTRELVAIQKNSVYCIVALCCDDNLLLSGCFGIHSSFSHFTNHFIHDDILFCDLIGSFQFIS